MIQCVKRDFSTFVTLQQMIQADDKVKMIHVDGGLADSIMHYVQPAQVEVSEVRLQLYKTGAFLNQ
jgi:hypothetical protein